MKNDVIYNVTPCSLAVTA